MTNTEKEKNTVTLLQFYEMLENHDWYCMMSDDARVDTAGAAAYRKLNKIAEQSAEHLALFEAYNSYMWTGSAWNTWRAPKPDKPKE